MREMTGRAFSHPDAAWTPDWAPDGETDDLDLAPSPVFGWPAPFLGWMIAAAIAWAGLISAVALLLAVFGLILDDPAVMEIVAGGAP